MFERLIGEIRQSHVFSSARPEAEWERHIPALWQEVSSATSRVGLWRALENGDFVAYCRATSPGCDEGGPNHFFGDYSQGFRTHFASAPFRFWFSTDANNNNFFGYRVDRIEYTRAP